MDQFSQLSVYYTEQYLFEVVSPRFQRAGVLDAFDVFCIVIWKANRSKSKIARRLLGHGYEDLESAARALTIQLAQATDARTRLLLLVDGWKLRLPMASAILTVLYPDEFTVYDVRVCGQLRAFDASNERFERLVNRKGKALWSEYCEFVVAVRRCSPQELSLREKDRWLFGRSFVDQLRQDVEEKFGIAAK